MAIALAVTSSALAQTSSSAKKDADQRLDRGRRLPNPDNFIEILRKDVRSQEKQIIAESMGLSDAEAEKFPPVYDQYATQLSRIYDTTIALLNDCALAPLLFSMYAPIVAFAFVCVRCALKELEDKS